MNNTTFDEVKDKFYSLIVSYSAIPETLTDEWLDSAIGEYELELGVTLEFEEIETPPVEVGGLPIITKQFATHLLSSQKSLLGRYMQREFITRQLSLYGKVTGIDSKDEKVSGLQATKVALRSELTTSETNIAELVAKLKEVVKNV